MKKPLIIITGPTAVGKTDLSISLAKKIGGEIISADSMQVYRGLDIGSAKITTEEMDGVFHHLIDILDFDEEFNVFLFKELAEKSIEDIYSRGNIPIICGGTGFYIQALLYDVSFSKEDNSKIRAELEKRVDNEGAEVLYKELQEIDPKSAEIIHPNNVKRIIRALEYFKLNGKLFSEHNETEKQKESPYNFMYFVIDDDRELLYQRINKRVDVMLSKGLVDEVKKLYEKGLRIGMTSAEGIGYKQLLPYLEGEISLDEATEKIKQDSRHYAKRQLTWFRREKETIWVDRAEFDSDQEKMLEFMINKIKEKGIYNE